MMSPVKFVTETLLSIIGSLILLWLILVVVFSKQTENQKKDMIDDSPFSKYKFGDEIKGYYMELIDEENMTFAVYTADRKHNNMS